MPKYNLNALGHEEFERLCQSLVQKIIGSGVKVYGMGRDGSREATFKGKALYPSKEEQWDGGWIFQAKFHEIDSKEARRSLLGQLDNELSKVIEYNHLCDNYILMTNVTLTPVFQKGIKDKIDNEIIPKYHQKIKNIHVWGADEICRFLDGHPDIRRSYVHLLISGDIIASILKLIESGETDLDELVKLYCQGCFDHEQYAALDDAGDVEDERVSLQRIFIDLNVKSPTLFFDQEISEKIPKWLIQATEDEERISALSYLLDDFIPDLVLIGGPGEGKSTLVQYLTQIYRARLIGKLNELGEKFEEFEKCIPRVPFRILLKEYAQWIASRDNSDSLFHYIATEVSKESGKNINPEDIHKILKSNPVILLLDGLDEVPEKKLRTRVLDNITSFVNQVRDVLKGNLRVIATTRPYGYSEEFNPTHYLHLTLQKLSTDNALIYAERWTTAKEANPREAERILKSLEFYMEDTVVSVLTKTPLQITILLVIIRARGSPPRQREELFECYMDIIYIREQKKCPEFLRTEKDVIYGLHKYLAYILHKRAEKDETAALMDVSEFEQKIKAYLIHVNPLLTKDEVESKVNQIIKEANQRLVLIESPQENKVGFGLTTTREFFAAAHLVDTSKNTKERDLRFKAIAKPPHWRNVALFFAGRVGRTRPGEASSMIDICREIDTEKVDKFLKRGAELVIGMVEDRVLREPHNEIGAIQYGLTLLDNGLKSEEFTNALESLPDSYKEQIIRPWLEDRLKNVVPEKMESYADIYQILFGVNHKLQIAIQRAAESDLRDEKLWALTKAIENRIVEIWVINLFEELADVIPLEEISQSVESQWYNFRYYLEFPLSPKVRAVIAYALLEGVQRDNFPLSPLPLKVIEELSFVKPEGKNKKNSLLLWAVCQLSMLSCLHQSEEINRRRDRSVEVHIPCIVNPNVKTIVNKNAEYIKEFCTIFSNEKEPFINFLVMALDLLLNPHSNEKFIKFVKEFVYSKKNTSSNLMFMKIFGMSSRNYKKQLNYQDFYNFCEYYTLEEQYLNDSKEFNELIHKESKSIDNHPYRLLLWMFCNGELSIEKFLDLEILSNFKNWLQNRGFSKNIHSFCIWSFRINKKINLEFLNFFLGIIENQKVDEQEYLLSNFGWLVSNYKWHEPKTDQELIIIERFKHTFENILAYYSSIIDFKHPKAEIIYWCTLNLGIVEEKQLIEFYEIFHNNSDFPELFWYHKDKIHKLLIEMLQSDKVELARLAAISLSISFMGLDIKRNRNEDTWIGDKLWELAKDEKDVWQLEYINCMAQFRLKWAKNHKEWLEAIKEASSEKFRKVWCQVIENSGYCENNDRDFLIILLIEILDSNNTFSKSIRFTALKRLHKLISEIPEKFDEEELNLPLSQRTMTNFPS